MECEVVSGAPPPKRRWLLRLADRGTALRLPWLLGALAVGLVAQRVTQTILDSFYARSGYPVPYYEGQLSFSAEKLAGWYAVMERSDTLGVYRQTRLVDFGFIMATALLFTAASLLVARAVPAGGKARRLALQRSNSPASSPCTRGPSRASSPQASSDCANAGPTNGTALDPLVTDNRDQEPVDTGKHVPASR